jgi:hypothetical protein
MLITEALCFAKADAVDNGSVVQCIGDDRIFFTKQWLEYPAIGIKSCCVQDGIFSAKKVRDLFFQFLVYVLCAANKPDAAHAIPVRINSFMRRLNHPGMGREPEIIVGTKIQYGFAAYGDLRALRAGDDPFGFYTGRQLLRRLLLWLCALQNLHS